MNSKIVFVLCVAATTVLASNSGCMVRFRSNAIQGSGVEATQDREIGSFHAIDMLGLGDVVAEIGPEVKLSVSFDDNLLDLVETEVIDGELRISTREEYNSKLPLVVKVTAPSIDKVKLSGVGSVELTGLDEKKLNVSVSGVGSLSASGKVDELAVNLSGTGKANLQELVAQAARVNVSGVGSAKIHAVKSINAKASGVGGITIYGNPTEVDTKATGVGSINIVE